MSVTSLNLLVSSADNFCKQFGPRSGSTKKQTIFFQHYYLTPLDMYNGLPQVYQTKRQNLLVYKGF